jgi:hypothetical protein
MVIELPTIYLQKDFFATVDKKLNEVRFLQIFEDGSRQVIFVPIENIRKLCEVIE